MRRKGLLAQHLAHGRHSALWLPQRVELLSLEFFLQWQLLLSLGGRLLMGYCGAVSSWPLPVPRSLQGAEPDRELGEGKGSYGSRTGPSAPPAVCDKLPA